jgi:hypothetical protein
MNIFQVTDNKTNYNQNSSERKPVPLIHEASQKEKLTPDEIRARVKSHFNNKNKKLKALIKPLNTTESDGEVAENSEITEKTQQAQEKADKMMNYNSQIKSALKKGSFNFSQKEREVLSKILV